MNGSLYDSGDVTRSRVWYSEGLRFSCTRCGSCCSNGPGTVRVNETEIKRLAACLQLTTDEFRDRYTRNVGDLDLSLREKPNHDCIFWHSEDGCRVYEHRPRQCRTWPFWHSNVSTPSSWRRAANDCPGMNQGPVSSADYVESAAAADGTLGSVMRLRRTS